MSAGMLLSQMEPPANLDGEFDDWYETEHIPARIAIAGFTSAVRYRAVVNGPRHLAVYQLRDMSALESPAYRELKVHPSERTERLLRSVQGFTRYTCDLISDTGSTAVKAGRLFVVAFDVPSEAEARFESWYLDEHIAMLMQADGWLRVRRYRTRPGFEGPPFTHWALHELRDERALDSPQRTRARSTSRRTALAAEPWFSSARQWIYAPISRHVALSDPEFAPESIRRST